MSDSVKKLDEERLAEIAYEMAQLKPMSDKYFDLSREYYKLEKAIKEKEHKSNLRKLMIQTAFEECSYPSMGVPGENGRANIKTLEQGEELIKALHKQCGYYRAYVLNWTGPGNYDVIPDYTIDHDNETIYTATFVKSEYQ